MALDNLVTIEGNLRDAYKQLQPGTMLCVDQLMNERRTNEELRHQWFYTADGEIYFLNGESKIPTLAITREAQNPVLQNIDDAFVQLLNNQNYRVLQADFEQALAAPDTVLVALPELRLFGNKAEWRYLEIGTTSAEYAELNKEERKLAERVYGRGDDFVKNMEMLKTADIGKTRIFVLNPDYVQKHAKTDAIARASWLGIFDVESQFDADDRYFDSHSRARGYVVRAFSKQEAPAGRDAQKIGYNERILKPVTKELLLPIARPYISGYDWNIFSARIPNHAPALEDVLLAAHKDNFVCEQVTPEFDQKMRELYFPPLPPKEEK